MRIDHTNKQAHSHRDQITQSSFDDLHVGVNMKLNNNVI